MGAQIILCDGFEVIPPPEMHDLELSGSNCGESTVTTEDGTVFSGDSSPGGGVAEEEWSEEKPFSFYVVKQPAYDDPEIKAKIEEADHDIYLCNKYRIHISNALKYERDEVVPSVFAQMESLVPVLQGYKAVFEDKMKEFGTIQDALRSLWCTSTDQLCFSKKELDHLIYIAHYVIEQGNIGLEEKDWVLKETEKPDGIILSEGSLAEKESSILRLKSMAVELSELKKEVDKITWDINQLTDKMGMCQNNIMLLEGQLAHILEKRDSSYQRIKMMRIKRDKANAAYFQSHAVMRKAKELAASGNARDLEVFASSEVDKFMTHWNSDKAFRDDYVKRSSLSLYQRQLSRDGRIKCREVQVVREKQALVNMRKRGLVVHKTNREDSSSNSSQDGVVITEKEAKEQAKDFNRSSAEESDVTDLEVPPVYKNSKKEEKEVDEETLKDRKQQELEKARLAMERKRKQQEKAAAKAAATAAIRAQKEAEKKLKVCEKKAKKKAAANCSSPLEPDHLREVDNEMEKAKALTVSGKEKHQKERSLFPKQRSFRYKHRGRGTEALPKAILNRRKAHRYWVWGVSSAALAFALFLVVLLLR